MIAYVDVLMVIGWREFSYVEENSVRNHAVSLIALGYRAISTFPFPTNFGGIIVEIQLHTVTPIWTGGVERQQMTRIQESSIIGSLRWWYEVIVRGLGGHACDPTATEGEAVRCRYDPQKTQPPGKQLCEVCQIFGATGWRRRFRLEVLEEFMRPIFDGSSVFIPSGRIHEKTYKGKKRVWAGGWYLVPGRVEDNTREDNTGIVLRIVSQQPGFYFESSLGVTFALIEKWGGLAAKNQLGYGVVTFMQREGEQFPWKNVEYTLPDNFPDAPPTTGLPALSDFFFSKIRFRPTSAQWYSSFNEIEIAKDGEIDGVTLKNAITNSNIEQCLDQGFFPISPIIRNWLRYRKLKEMPSNHQNYVWGTTEKLCPGCYSTVRRDKKRAGNFWCSSCKRSLRKSAIIERVASKINISFAYQLPNSDCWEIRIWGWIPRTQPNLLNLNRTSFIQSLFDVFRYSSRSASAGNGAIWTDLFQDKLEPCSEFDFEWREFLDSNRDTHEYHSPSDFLHALLMNS